MFRTYMHDGVMIMMMIIVRATGILLIIMAMTIMIMVLLTVDRPIYGGTREETEDRKRERERA